MEIDFTGYAIIIALVSAFTSISMFILSYKQTQYYKLSVESDILNKIQTDFESSYKMAAVATNKADFITSITLYLNTADRFSFLVIRNGIDKKLVEYFTHQLQDAHSFYNWSCNIEKDEDMAKEYKYSIELFSKFSIEPIPRVSQQLLDGFEKLPLYYKEI